MSDKPRVPMKKQQLNIDRKSSTERQDTPAESSTGAIQKRKSNFKAVKPNSLKNSSEVVEGTYFFLFFYVSSTASYMDIFLTFPLIFCVCAHTYLLTETSNLIKFKNSHLGKSAPCKYRD